MRLEQFFFQCNSCGRARKNAIAELLQEQRQEAKAWEAAQGFKAAARRSRIGKGSFCAVYLAENREEGSIAAVRFSSSTDRAQMAREVAPAATLQQHPP